MNLLVVGARPDSLGAAVAKQAREAGWDVMTMGVSGEEFRMDLITEDLEAFMALYRVDHVVCTAGINRAQGPTQSARSWWDEHMLANVVGPMRLLDAYAKIGPTDGVRVGHFVAISSNSAHIPRTNSGPYCASKAALSMALRVAARDAAVSDDPTLVPYVVYGYEPGLLRGTPMTKETAARLPGAPLTRMRGFGVHEGLSVYGLANHIVHNIGFGGPELNGCLLRLDAGEV